MADTPDKDQQTEAPTEKRKADALKDGDVFASKELATAVMMAAGARVDGRAWRLVFLRQQRPSKKWDYHSI